MPHVYQAQCFGKVNDFGFTVFRILGLDALKVSYIQKIGPLSSFYSA